MTMWESDYQEQSVVIEGAFYRNKQIDTKLKQIKKFLPDYDQRKQGGGRMNYSCLNNTLVRDIVSTQATGDSNSNCLKKEGEIACQQILASCERAEIRTLNRLLKRQLLYR